MMNAIVSEATQTDSVGSEISENDDDVVAGRSLSWKRVWCGTAIGCVLLLMLSLSQVLFEFAVERHLVSEIQMNHGVVSISSDVLPEFSSFFHRVNFPLRRDWNPLLRVEGIMYSGRPSDSSHWKRLSGFHRLYHLELKGNWINSQDLKSIHESLNLKTFQMIVPNQTEAVDLSEISNARQLEFFRFKGVFTDEALVNLAKVKTLERLVLVGSIVSEQGLQSLSTLPQLCSLDIDMPRLTDAEIDQLSSFPKLRTLTLRGLISKPSQVQKLRSSLPNCSVFLR